MATRMRAAVMALTLAATLSGAAPATAVDPLEVAPPAPEPGLLRYAVRSGEDGGVERRLDVGGIRALRSAATVTELQTAWHAHTSNLVASMSAGGGWIEDVVAVGDLSGDRRADVVLIRSSGDAVRYVALRGTNGRKLWHVDVSAPGVLPAHRFGYVIPMHTSDGPAVLAVTESFAFEYSPELEADVFTVRTDLTAVEAGGRVLWSRGYEGGGTFSEAGMTMADVAFPIGVGPVTDPGDDIVVRSDSATYSVAGGGTTSVEVIDGATGFVRPLAVTVSQEPFPAVGADSDLDGDGLRDVVTATTARDETDLTALSGVTGAPLWRRAVQALVWSIEGAGPTTRSRGSDLAIVAFGEDSWFGTVHLLSGADGRTLWRRPGDLVLPVRDLNRDRRADVVLVGLVDDNRRFGLRYTAVTGRNATLYRRVYAVSFPRGGGGADLMVGPVGDVDGDRRRDFGHEMSSYGVRSGTVDRERGPVRSRDGRKTFSGAIGEPLYGRIDRRGDDLATHRNGRGMTTVIARDGRTGNEIRRWRFRTRGRGWSMAAAKDLTGDRRGEMLLYLADRRGVRVRVLDGRTGRVRWRR